MTTIPPRETATTWNLERIAANSHRMTFDLPFESEQWVLFMSDEHFDNKHCELEMLARHHDEAKERGAPIIKVGDIFCAMQGKWDKRADQNDLREEHRGNNYLDRLVDTAADFYAPWASSIAYVSAGNHETSIGQRHQTNLIDRLVEGLRYRTGHAPMIGAYSGFLTFKFKLNATNSASKVAHLHHGYGGGGEVTRGMIDNNRTRGQYHADIYFSGHIHRRNEDENLIITVDANGNPVVREQIFIRGSSYKSEGMDGNGWHTTQGRAARPLGGWWVRFKHLSRVPDYLRGVKGAKARPYVEIETFKAK